MQGERRFFRVCFHWLANEYPEIAKRNLEAIPEYRRWDDLLYSTIDTSVEGDALYIIKKQLALDVQSKTPSLLAKWLPSENTSSLNTKKAAAKVRKYLGFTHKEYRKTLSELRKRINVLERLMSANRWDEIEFDKIPSKAGMKYRNTFAVKEVTAARYAAFMKDKETKVNAGVLNPVDIAHQAFSCYKYIESSSRIALQKYWDALPNYYGDREENGLAIVDVSGSMYGTPMEAAVSLGAYIAEKAHGPFANHFITFSEKPELVEFSGVDIVDKFRRCCSANWGYNTDIEKVFDMLLKTALDQDVDPRDIPTRLYIFSDMQFDCGMNVKESNVTTLLEAIALKWKEYGYELPQVIFWNLDARDNTIPAIGGRFAYISGFSPVMIEQILSGKDGWSICLDKLLSKRYEIIK